MKEMKGSQERPVEMGKGSKQKSPNHRLYAILSVGRLNSLSDIYTDCVKGIQKYMIRGRDANESVKVVSDSVCI